MKKVVLFLIIGFLGGFFTHALLTPDLFSNGILFLPQTNQATIPTEGKQQATPTPNPLETIITYDGTDFSRTNIHIEVSRYLTIINKSKEKQMNLVSNEEELSTPRPYAYMEQLHTRMDKPGTFIVNDRIDPTIRLVITVN